MTMNEDGNIEFTCGFQYLSPGRGHDRFGQEVFCYLKIGPVDLDKVLKERPGIQVETTIELRRTLCYMDKCPIYRMWRVSGG